VVTDRRDLSAYRTSGLVLDFELYHGGEGMLMDRGWILGYHISKLETQSYKAK
jgi:hypothetical protein